MCYREMYFTESELDFRQKESTEHYCLVLNCVLYWEYCTGLTHYGTMNLRERLNFKLG